MSPVDRSVRNPSTTKSKSVDRWAQGAIVTVQAAYEAGDNA